MKNKKHFVCLVAMLLLAVGPALAQISYESETNHKQEKKRMLKEAKKAKAEADYKETHLNPSAFNLKKGKAGRRKGMVKERNGLYTYKDTKPIKLKSQKTRKKDKQFKKKD